MSRLFESYEKLQADWPYGRISPRMCFFYAMMSAFIVGAEMVRIIVILHPHGQAGDLVQEGACLVLWLAFGVLSGRVALERLNR